MEVSAQTGAVFGPLLGDAEIADVLSSEAFARTMVAVEIALAEAEAEVGVIPADAGARMVGALEGFAPDLAELGDGVRANGIPVPALLAQMRDALPDNLAHVLHWGATTQDILDTAAMVQAGACIDVLSPRLSALVDRLVDLADAHRETVMAGRTWGQVAAPITLGLRIAQWAQPLISAERELPALRARALRVQFGGAVGTQAVVAPHGPAIARGMAERLGLVDAPPWHTDRSGILALAGWLTSVTAALSKMAGDLVVLARSEVGEARAGASGGSSTMPQKANPVGASAIVALGSVAQASHAGLLSAAAPAEERDGSKWAVEWVLLPQLFMATGAVLRHSLELAETLEADTDAMRATLAAHPGAFAEAASFALAKHMPRAEAQALVKRAAASGEPLRAALETATDAPVDWDAVFDPGSVVEPSGQIIDAIFAARAR